MATNTHQQSIEMRGSPAPPFLGANWSPTALRSEIRIRDRWPEAFDPAAYHGLAGDIVRLIGPQSEADEAAILIQTLVFFGALVGRGPSCPR